MVFSCGLMCFALRRFKVFAQGLGAILIVVAAYAIIQPATFSNMIASLTSSVVYKGHDPTQGVLASRESPWQAAVESITSNFWFGTGSEPRTIMGKIPRNERTNSLPAMGVTTENGSSYLAIVEWVGMLGILPFLFVVFAIAAKSFRTVRWMLITGNPSHPAVPLAMVMVAGLIHAAFEDWMFAPGYYLCVFFWSLAFVLVDVAPKSLPDLVPGRPWFFRQAAGSMAPRA